MHATVFAGFLFRTPAWIPEMVDTEDAFLKGTISAFVVTRD